MPGTDAERMTGPLVIQASVTAVASLGPAGQPQPGRSTETVSRPTSQAGVTEAHAGALGPLSGPRRHAAKDRDAAEQSAPRPPDVPLRPTADHRPQAHHRLHKTCAGKARHHQRQMTAANTADGMLQYLVAVWDRVPAGTLGPIGWVYGMRRVEEAGPGLVRLLTAHGAGSSP